ncbi:MAG: amidohydrolase family protein [Clostridia bacterium]|nr:amidohydrolase family protein [Clostridia bacterium]
MQPIIDCHCHIYPDKIVEKAVESIGKFYNLKMHTDGKLSTLLSESDSAGITHSLIFSVATKPQQTKAINEFIANEVSLMPQRFTGLGTLHPDSTDIKGDIEHLIELGLKGVKLHPDIQGVAIDDRRCMKIYEQLEGKLPLLLHTGDKRYQYSNPENLIPVLKTFENLTVIGAHFGGYSVWESASEKLFGYDNLYVDCSSSLAFMSPEMAKELIDGFRAEHVLFATDYPMWTIQEEIERFEKINLTKDERRMIYYQNACKVFGLDEKKILEINKTQSNKN